MNEELQLAITQVIQSMTGVAESAYAFGAEQMPDVIEQLLMFNSIKQVVFIVLFSALTAVFVKLGFLAAKCYDVEISSMGMAASVAGGSLFCICAVLDVVVLIKILVAPKVWLIEYAAGLVR
jgi:hypothetical protein